MNKAATTTVITSSANPSVTGQSVTYTATVTANSPGAGTPTGTVNFRENTTTITGCGAKALNGSGQATCVVSYNASGGNHTQVNGVYSSDADFSASTSVDFTQTVDKADTTTVITSSVNPSVTGQSVTYTATVTATSPGAGTPTGTVNFRENTTTITGCGAKALNGSGQATCVVSYNASGGNHTQVNGVYSSDADFSASTSVDFTQTVNKADTTTAIASSANPSGIGDQVTYTATVAVTAPGAGTPGGTVTFEDGAAPIVCESGSAAFDGTSATCNVTYSSTAGSPHSITAVYDGDANFATSTSSALSQTVAQPYPIWVATGDTVTRTSYGSFAPPIPTGTQAGDFMLLIVANTTNSTPSTPSGWSPVASDGTNTSPDVNLSVFYRFYVAGDSAPSVSVSVSGGVAAARIVSYRNVNTTTPLDVTPVTSLSGSSSASSFAPDGLTTATANARAVSIVTENDGGGSAPTLGFGGGGNAQGFVAETGFPDAPSGGDHNDHLAVDVTSKPIPSASAVTFPTYTTSDSRLWAGVSIALRPVPAPAAKVVFTTQPTDTTAGATITPAVEVSVEDASGNVEATDNATQVTVAIGNNAGPGSLSGTVTRTVFNGVATFNDLSINNTGSGYTLTAASTGLTGATSSAFNITAAPVCGQRESSTSADDANTSGGHQFDDHEQLPDDERRDRAHSRTPALELG